MYSSVVSVTDPSKMTASLNILNPFGQIAAQEYPKLPLYGFLSIFYVLVGVFWLVKSSIHWRELLPIQNYLSGVILFLMIEQAFNYGYYENYNSTGIPSSFLMILVAILNAGRNTGTF